jgi:hypothetical protein
MTFDETLHQAFETLSDRLRAELQTAADELTAAFETECGRLAEARAVADREAAERQAAAAVAADASMREAEARALEQGREQGRQSGWEAGRQEGHAEGFAAGRDAERDTARSGFRVAALAASERLIDGVRLIDQARSLSEVLDTLASCAGREAPRAAVLVVRGDRVRGWRLVGFDPAFDSPDTIDLALADAGVIADAVRTGAAASATPGGIGAPRFASLPAGRESVAVPISMSGQIVAVLYADQGASEEDRTSGNREERRANAEPALGWRDRLELLTRHAARCLEAITAFKAARVLLEWPDLPGASDPQWHQNRPGDHRDAGGSGGRGDSGEPGDRGDAGEPGDAGDPGDPGDPGDNDAAARRYARLLVSEIKLYHEPAVAAGRRERDLATRLSVEIARARLLYEQRVPAPVRRRTDYFHAELVRTLANGDAALLELKTAR